MSMTMVRPVDEQEVAGEGYWQLLLFEVRHATLEIVKHGISSR